MTDFVDVKLDKSKGYYDIVIEGEDIAGTEGLDTSILVSILSDARATESEQPNELARRGWWGDLFNTYPIGSKIWLATSKSLTQLTVNEINDYIKNCLQWMINENYADSINVDTIINYINESVDVTVLINKSGIVTEQQLVILENT